MQHMQPKSTLQEFKESISARLPALAEQAFDWRRMRDVASRVTVRSLKLIQSFQDAGQGFGKRYTSM